MADERFEAAARLAAERSYRRWTLVLVAAILVVVWLLRSPSQVEVNLHLQPATPVQQQCDPDGGACPYEPGQDPPVKGV